MSCCEQEVLYAGNSQILRLKSLTDQVSGMLVSVATVTATLKDPNANPVAGLTDLILEHEGGSPELGNYSGVLDGSEFNPPVGPGYLLIVDGDSGDAILHLEIPITIAARTE